MRKEKDKYFILTLEVIVEGFSIDSIEKHLEFYEDNEEYLKCAGIKKALDYSRYKTVGDILLELEKIENETK